MRVERWAPRFSDLWQVRQDSRRGPGGALRAGAPEQVPHSSSLPQSQGEAPLLAQLASCLTSASGNSPMIDNSHSAEDET